MGIDGRFKQTSPEIATPAYDRDIGGIQNQMGAFGCFFMTLCGIAQSYLNRTFTADEIRAIHYRALADGSLLLNDQYANLVKDPGSIIQSALFIVGGLRRAVTYGPALKDANATVLKGHKKNASGAIVWEHYIEGDRDGKLVWNPSAAVPDALWIHSKVKIYE